MRKIAIGLILGLVLAYPLAGMTASSDTYRQLDLFGIVFERIHKDYVRDVEDAELIEAAINGMLSSLDPHSSYLNPRRFQDMQVETRGEFGGLGIEVTMEEGVVKVVAPIDETPADRAGMQAGDLITHLNDEPILGLTLSEAVEKMRGPVGSDLTLTVIRKGEDKPFKVTITRDVITVKSVRARREKDAAYIRVTTFNEQTEQGLKKSLRNLKREIGPNMSGVILDLRNNPGGLLDQAVAVADSFLDEGEIVSTRGRHTHDSQRRYARPGDQASTKPIVILINGGSASASEIVAGALQDHHRAILVGTKSFGKGSVQTIIPLSNGADGALRLTTARYFTPSGRSIQATGINPDIVLKHKREVEEESAIPLPSEAVLRNHLLAQDEDSEEAHREPPTYLVSEGERIAVPAGVYKLDGATFEEAEDNQLAFALAVLETINSGATVN